MTEREKFGSITTMSLGDQFDLMTEQQLAEIRVRCQNATPGPWTAFVEGGDHLGGDSIIRTQGDDIFLGRVGSHDADFIAHAREDVQKLLADIEHLKGLLSKA